MARSVCIVSNEIYPVDRGGIARLLHNFATTNASRPHPVDMHFLLASRLQKSAHVIEGAYSGLATVHFCADMPAMPGPLGDCIRTAGSSDALNEQMMESLRSFDGLLEAQRRCGYDFDVVEFPDFGGWAATAIAAKRSGIALANTQIAVRLHSAFALIARHEPFAHEPSAWMAARCDLERQSLRDADLIVAHLKSTARANAKWFGLSAEWANKLRIEMPPISLSRAEDNVRNLLQPKDAPRDFLFSSRLQPFKRPDVFVRAAVHFLDTEPGIDSMFRIVSYGWDADYIDWLERQVPARWRERVIFADDVSEDERTRLVLGSILVIPSDFESLCLLAFEARLLNVKTILNRQCAAFGQEPQLWRDGEDCLFFDGDFLSLAETMKRALSWTRAALPMPEPGAPYWEGYLPEASAAPESAPLGLALIVYGHGNPYDLAAELRSLAALRVGEIHALVSRDAIAAATFPEDALAACAVTLHITGWAEPTAAEIRSVVATLDADAVAFLPAGMRVEPEFWRLAAARLAQVEEAGVFTSHLLVASNDNAKQCVLNFGDCPTVALVSDRIAHRASVFRRDTILKIGLRDAAGDRWHQDLCIRLVEAGCRVLVAPAALASQNSPGSLSRISGARFFAWHRDVAAQKLGAAFRAGSLVEPVDSTVAISHERWRARQEEEEEDLAACATLAPPPFRFMGAVLKSAILDPTAAYRELEIVLRGLSIGGSFVPWLGMKLVQFNGEPQLEFRESGNAKILFRDWPPATADQWGPVAVWTARGTPHPYGPFFQKMVDPDARKLMWLVENLPIMVDALELPDGEAEGWKDAARRLVPNRDSQQMPPTYTDAGCVPENIRAARNGLGLGRLGGLHRIATRSVRLASRVAGRLSGKSRSNY